MRCWIAAFNAQGSRGTIVAVQVGAVEALRKKERQGETQNGFLSFIPHYESHLVYDQTQASGVAFSLLYEYL